MQRLGLTQDPYCYPSSLFHELYLSTSEEERRDKERQRGKPLETALDMILTRINELMATPFKIDMIPQ